MNEIDRFHNEIWPPLCREFAIAKDEFYHWEGVLNQNPVPTAEILNAHTLAQARLNDVMQRMDEACEEFATLL